MHNMQEIVTKLVDGEKTRYTPFIHIMGAMSAGSTETRLSSSKVGSSTRYDLNGQPLYHSH